MSAFNPGAQIGGFVRDSQQRIADVTASQAGGGFSFGNAFNDVLRTAATTAQTILPIWAAAEFNRQSADRYARPVFITGNPADTTTATVGYQPPGAPGNGQGGAYAQGGAALLSSPVVLLAGAAALLIAMR